ncbi:hypothetical protein DPMN_051233 [Dreissena polymorpha]|uniref:Uncharacterized protein n=1 Tax=Dreissena polymorpha TaxID=45954 RepID=A0A9D4CHI1_DREPO|nr:hypothetical protein DPMN_051233 [Dreissena polymorpha]
MLFGDDIGKEITNCVTNVSFSKDLRQRGRGFGPRPFRGFRGRGFNPAGFAASYQSGMWIKHTYGIEHNLQQELSRGQRARLFECLTV